MMTLDEAISHAIEVAELNDEKEIEYAGQGMYISAKDCRKCASEHRQLAEWLRELKIHREIHDVLLQLLVDFDLDICCDDLMDNEEEQKICEENCNNKAKGCWVRWAKLKAREVNAGAEIHS